MIIESDPPTQSTAIVTKEIAWAIGTGSLARLVGQPIPPGAVTLTLAHAITLPTLAELRTAAVPRIAGWGYLVEVNQEVVAQATTSFDGNGHRFGGFAAGFLPVATAEAAQLADEKFAADPRPLTLREVRVGPVHATLLQVTLADGSPEAFVPIGPNPGLPSGQVLTSDVVRAVLLRQVEPALHAPQTAGVERLGG